MLAAAHVWPLALDDRVRILLARRQNYAFAGLFVLDDLGHFFGRLPAQRLAYVRLYSARGGMTLVEAYERLIAWYQARGGDLNTTVLYGMSQDDPEITPERLCRFDWCLRVPKRWQGQGEVKVISFPACTVAVLPCDGDVALEYENFLYLFTHWLPRSSYQPANLPGMEIYRRPPSES